MPWARPGADSPLFVEPPAPTAKGPQRLGGPHVEIFAPHAPSTSDRLLCFRSAGQLRT